MKYKWIIVGGAIIASAFLGDYLNISDKIEYLKYKEVKVDPEGYDKPFKIEKRYRVNKKGFLEVYIGHDNKWYKVKKDMRVNERCILKIIQEEGKKARDDIIKKIEEIIEWSKEVIKNDNLN